MMDLGAAYRLQLGDFNVFEQRKNDGARLLIMMDVSGSMGTYMEPEQRREYVAEYASRGVIVQEPTNNATLAWETAAALRARYPQAEMFTFHSNSHQTVISPIPDGFRQSSCRGNNADCAMLLWLRDYLGTDTSNTTVVLISDGYPNGSHVECNSIRHTKQVAQEMHDDGVQYISVLVNQEYNDLYPAGTVALVRESGDYENLIEAFDALDAQGY
jgi:hypothetical protein